MQFIKINNKTLISKFGIGTYQNFGEKINSRESEKIILNLYNRGVNFIDSSVNYSNGYCEKLIGKILKKKKLRKDFFIASKVFFSINKNIKTGLSQKNIEFSLKKTLNNYQTDYIDCLQCHRFDPKVNLYQLVEVFENQIIKGKIIYWGTTNWPYSKIIEIQKICKFKDRFIFNQLPLNILYKKNINFFKKLKKKKFINIVYGVLSKGLISNNFIKEKYHKKFKENLNFNAKNIEIIKNLYILCKKNKVSLEEFTYSFIINQRFVDIVLSGISSINYLKNLDFEKIFDKKLLNKCLLEIKKNETTKNIFQNWK